MATTIKGLQATISALTLERDTIRGEINSLAEKAEKARLEYMDRRDIWNAKSAEANKRIEELSAQIAAEQTEVDVGDFLKISAEMDKSGETPALLARWKRLTGALRSAGRIGQSHEVVLSILDRLQGKGMPLPHGMLTYSGVAKTWIKKEHRNESRVSTHAVSGAEIAERVESQAS